MSVSAEGGTLTMTGGNVTAAGDIALSASGAATLNLLTALTRNGGVNITAANGLINLFNSNINSAADILVQSLAGAVTLNGSVFNSSNGSIRATAGNGNIQSHLLRYTAAQDIVLQANNGQLILGSGGGDTLSAAGNVALNASGAVNLNGTVLSSTGESVSVTSGTGALSMTGGNVTAAKDISLSGNGVTTNGGLLNASGGVNIAAGTGALVLNNTVNAGNDIHLAAGGGGIRVDNGGSLVSASGNITLDGTSGDSAAGVHLNGTAGSKVNISAVNGTITLNGTSATGAGVLVTNALVDAVRAAIHGQSTRGSYGFSLTDTTLGANLASLQNVTLSSAGSGAGATNLLDNSVVNDTNRDSLLNKQIENMTTVEMNGTAVFGNGTEAWEQKYQDQTNPNGGWIFNNATVNAASADVSGVGFTNSTLTVNSGGLTIANNGTVVLSDSTVTASNGEVTLSSTAGGVNLTGTTITAKDDLTVLVQNGDASMSNATL
ncbi:TPA: hypothetical protein N3G98_004802, partial [Salmonella enterica subsp. enterica serovar Denver]|nr:hypothetical protein [Salmonella enterica subsp. enterica serovar Denver]HCM3794607.1 hypothetical protein [Salmonella enterica subsp. enterica serovar Denver]